jgi:hypothetical protein
MREHRLTTPELLYVGVTRGMIGLGAGLLLAGRLVPRHRRALGAALLGAGALSTLPIAMRVLRGRALDAAVAGMAD